MIRAIPGNGVVETTSPRGFFCPATRNRCERGWAEVSLGRRVRARASAHDHLATHETVRARNPRSCLPASSKIALSKLHLKADRARRRGPISVDALLIGTARATGPWFAARPK